MSFDWNRFGYILRIDIPDRMPKLIGSMGLVYLTTFYYKNHPSVGKYSHDESTVGVSRSREIFGLTIQVPSQYRELRFWVICDIPSLALFQVLNLNPVNTQVYTYFLKSLT